MVEVVLGALFVLGVPLLTAAVAWFSERDLRPPRTVQRDTSTRAIFIAGALWAGLTALGVALVSAVDVYPVVLSDKGEDIDRAFRVLSYLSVPVCALVLAVLAYGLLRSGYAELPPEDGPPMQGRGAGPLIWLSVTSALAVLVMIYPGLTSLSKVVHNPDDPDLLVQVDGLQWTWLVAYPSLGIENQRELILPVDKTVRFEITSRDVLHSFWIPAFLMKIDAIPGYTTVMSLKPVQEGSYEMDSTIRLQCAELCGLSHANMSIPVQVVSEREFNDWVSQKQAAASRTTDLTLIAQNQHFLTSSLQGTAGDVLAIAFENRDGALSHNWALYASREAAVNGAAPIFVSNANTGPSESRFELSLSQPGRYFFRCELHPDLMTGTLTVSADNTTASIPGKQNR